MQMDNTTFLQYYQLLQYSIMGEHLISLDKASITFNRKSDSSFWNHAFLLNPIQSEDLREIEQTLKNLGRKPAVYFEKSKDMHKISDLLHKSGYRKSWEDSWMFFSEKEVNVSHNGDVQKVKSQKDLDVFLETFNACYKKDDPQNPYGELGEYLDVTERVWKRHNKNNRIEYFTVFEKNEPVAVSTLTNFAGIGYISNVGSKQSVRGHGFGKAASLYAVQKSIENRNSKHCLATEEGDYPNEFYKRIGFETEFTAVGYVRK